MKNSFTIGRFTVSMHSLLMLVFAVFYILKIMRAFSGTTAQGGIWNYIQLFFVFFGFALFAIRISYFINKGVVVSLFIYSVLAMINAMIFLNLNTNEVFDYLMIPYSFCVLVIAYEAGRNHEIETNAILTVVFYATSAIFIFSMLRRGVYSTSTGAVADVYYILGLFPMMLIWTKRFRLVPMVVCGVAVLVSGKRTGFFCFIAMILVYYVVNIFQTGSVQKHLITLLKLFLILAVFAILFYYIDSSFNNKLLIRLMRAIEESDSSGRISRWSRINFALDNTNPFQWLFGFGNGAVSHDFNGYAHNDFLEIIYDFGFPVLCAYIVFYFFIIKEFIKMMLLKYIYAAQFAMTLVFALFLAFASLFIINPSYITSGCLCFGFILTDFERFLDPEIDSELVLSGGEALSE